MTKPLLRVSRLLRPKKRNKKASLESKRSGNLYRADHNKSADAKSFPPWTVVCDGQRCDDTMRVSELTKTDSTKDGTRKQNLKESCRHIISSFLDLNEHRDSKPEIIPEK